MAGFDYTYEIGSWQERSYQIGVRTDPALDDVRSFAVVLFFERVDGSRVEVAKIDDAEHAEGTVHFDRYYRSEGAERKDFGVDVSSVFEAEDLLAENWRKYARIYERNED